jgi:hypothetical protein
MIPYPICALNKMAFGFEEWLAHPQEQEGRQGCARKCPASDIEKRL